MKIKQFSTLDDMEQHEAMWECGVMVGDRIEGEYRIVLYQIFEFYIELYYHIELNVLRKLVAFDKLDALDVYLNQLNWTQNNLLE